jgi:hypothetical protein
VAVHASNRRPRGHRGCRAPRRNAAGRLWVNVRGLSRKQLRRAARHVMSRYMRERAAKHHERAHLSRRVSAYGPRPRGSAVRAAQPLVAPDPPRGPFGSGGVSWFTPSLGPRRWQRGGTGELETVGRHIELLATCVVVRRELRGRLGRGPAHLPSDAKRVAPEEQNGGGSAGQCRGLVGAARAAVHASFRRPPSQRSCRAPRRNAAVKPFLNVSGRTRMQVHRGARQVIFRQLQERAAKQRGSNRRSRRA